MLFTASIINLESNSYRFVVFCSPLWLTTMTYGIL